MSDLLSKELSKLARRIDHSRLSHEVIHEVKRRFIDSIACLFAGYGEDVSEISRKFAEVYHSDNGSTLIGSLVKVPSEIAGFANGTAIRSLDFNDTYLSLEPQHPSDVIAPLLALAEERSIAPTRLVSAIALAYEVGVILCDAASLKANGWDHVNYITVTTVVGGAHLLGLSEEQTEQALALAVVPHAAARQTRNGEISMWKGAAAANAARNAIVAIKLAESGMKGPYQPFSGSMGFNALLLKDKMDMERVAEQIRAVDQPQRILNTYIKNWAVEYMTQVAIEAALELRSQFRDLDDIARIKVETFQLAYDVLAKDEEKWSPKTRETADHSLPYIVMAALEDGRIDLDTFAPERISSPETLSRIQTLVTVTASEELTAEYPDGNPTVLTIEFKNGNVLRTKIKYPIGHVGKPMSDQQLNEKFITITTNILEENQQQSVLKLLWELDKVRTYPELMTSLVLAGKTNK
ncbi:MULTISPECIES: MmgE/PrpD family protein [unclassified Paenibacillus]|uniref:MmgE/PrpD family protein n=1 Tax=unclassified Paenibacillus TaxID=185978 RepID=UPI001AE372A2|nr:MULTISPECIES: MmgE/PrpD family protein [unclassified Paenibacillus]MBP1155564.1 2-methylcitrate dehydratase [Paenibacillus sp. PvP091]MBP1169050.1 2-methylcitrate dehydratase [Paenibacillus sp. PvR098]MBP2440078.1 2-methylcitrate dehydratase [Paenibacillus sp. PvP052]